MTGCMNSHSINEFKCELSPGDRTTSYRMALQVDWPLRREKKTTTRNTDKLKGQLALCLLLCMERNMLPPMMLLFTFLCSPGK